MQTCMKPPLTSFAVYERNFLFKLAVLRVYTLKLLTGRTARNTCGFSV
jgi:hypothetical protein